MDLRLTKAIQDSIKEALVKFEFSEKHREEAEKISKLDFLTKETYPVSTDLVEYVAKYLGMIYTADIKCW
jgi:hypothetical protein